jgi:hypothetical protein
MDRIKAVALPNGKRRIASGTVVDIFPATSDYILAPAHEPAPTNSEVNHGKH